MIIPVILFAIGLVLLIKGGDWFVDGASGIAHRFHIPELLIGATVVSIGTTLPEVMVSATSAAQGSGAMAYGNAIGSIICNTSLIAALTVAIRPAKAERKSLIFPVIFFFAVAAFYVAVSYLFGTFDRWSGIVLLLAFLAYMTVLVLQAKKAMKPVEPNVDLMVDALDDEVAEEEQGPKGDAIGFVIVGAALLVAQGISLFAKLDGGFLAGVIGAMVLLIGILKLATGKTLGVLNSNVIFLIIGAAVIALGADLLVDNGTKIAEALGVPQTVIALTFVALGTSLPELVTAITSLVKGHGALSLGNVIGANIFNLVLVSGLSIAISPFEVPVGKLIGGMNASLVVDIPVMLAVMGLLTIPTLIKGKLYRAQGIILLAIYAGFCAVQFVL
ncbi:MAG: calcium/sodium antiporter [Clostridia bacterium]|nr:calcium/sodium antiporter [Clostridia bacterium]